jgi:hypothetical protein
MTTRQALHHARSRVVAIALWALVATLVGVVLRALEQLPVGGVAGRVAEWVGGVAWSLASFFVVPVLALEDVGVGMALRRSARTIRARWGESITGAGVIGAAFMFGVFGVFAVLAAGVAIGRSGFAPGYVLAAVAAAAAAALMVVQEAVAMVFRLAVFRYAAGEGEIGPFAAADLDAAFRSRRRRR